MMLPLTIIWLGLGSAIFGAKAALGCLVLMIFAYVSGRYDEEMERRVGVLRSAPKRENTRRENDDWSRDDSWFGDDDDD